MENNFFSKFFPESIKFWAKSKSVVGVDIGSSSIKVVQLRKEKEQAILETYGELATGPYAKRTIGQIVQLSEEMAMTMLTDLFRESGVKTKEAVVAIPMKSSFITLVKLPMVAGKNTEDMIQFEARKYIPVPLSEVEMDWSILDESEPAESSDIQVSKKEKQKNNPKARLVNALLVVIHKNILQKYKGIFTKLGLKIKSFEIETFSSLRSSVFHQIAPVAVIDLGALTTKMGIVDKGVLKSSRAIDKGSQEITSTISKSLGISFERAEEMKRKVGMSNKPEYKELVRVIESVLSIIFIEVQQFMANYRNKHGDSVSKVVLTGGGSLLEGIMDMAVKNLGVEVVLSDPFSKTGYPVFLQGTLKKIGPSFSVAVGLALRGL